MGGAKRYPSMPGAEGDGFRFALPILRMTCLRDLAALIARGLLENFPPSLSEGAGKTGCLLHPRSRVRFAQNKTAHEHTGQREHSGLPCAMALRLTSCSPRRTALLPPLPALLIARL